MSKLFFLRSLFLLIVINTITAQQSYIDQPFSKKKMLEDFEIFKNIRKDANSGLYKYRTKKQIDSIYDWAKKEINQSSTYLDFYNIICKLTDFEGSTHNNTLLPKKIYSNLKKETTGYFPLPLKLIKNEWIVNIKNKEIPLGASIISIDGINIENIIKKMYKYYTTDGINTTGKQIGINSRFGKFYRYVYGTKKKFKVVYKTNTTTETIHLNSISYKEYTENFKNRYSKPFDNVIYDELEEDDYYNFKKINSETGILTVRTFAIGWHAKDLLHKKYVSFLDSIFSGLKKNPIKNLIVDVRYNGGGSDPNDLVTYSYLADRKFSENKSAFIPFQKIPHLKYIDSKIPSFLRPLFVGKYNKDLQEDFYLEKEGKFYQGPLSNDHKIWKPNKNVFQGTIYLLIDPCVASAASLFAAMLTGNKNSIVIGEESMGGYYGHNGHSPISYVLPNSKIKTSLFLVNLEQDVPKEKNQKYNRGIIPDYKVSQSYNDYLNHVDTQLNFTLELINKKTNN